MLRAALVCFACAAAVAASSPPASAATGAACKAKVLQGVLPVWARGGFSDPKPRLPHEVGASGQIAALLFGHPLHYPATGPRSNKILWVERTPSTPSALRISARLVQADGTLGPVVARRVTGGPGPSIIDLPAEGCWRLTLRWAGRSDKLDLRYT